MACDGKNREDMLRNLNEVKESEPKILSSLLCGMPAMSIFLPDQQELIDLQYTPGKFNANSESIDEGNWDS
eukprot:CAMPEP_0113320084 /NCGR_PEP_ID=MMETSP0010_2-20120614/14023_1 /TAXON_ID=216773 ORGANISM="Corethron hystrix, Strain 308" /NCGR_SAMPLE_ID=MMETSP0010_2 /ASSEMBLY_ACC=CAM_ASM_000155 /LENGTH=70 /DNA_ID=CAMNT_0000177773 /DNA_START=278 /DNA_END=487 /DNA_ORIENTATION=- /assembly_acc=CAM_ASM_000155